jgi:hypothetical protein
LITPISAQLDWLSSDCTADPGSSSTQPWHHGYLFQYCNFQRAFKCDVMSRTAGMVEMTARVLDTLICCQTARMQGCLPSLAIGTGRSMQPCALDSISEHSRIRLAASCCRGPGSLHSVVDTCRQPCIYNWLLQYYCAWQAGCLR